MARILIVDDNALVRRNVASLLTAEGHETLAVESGERAVEHSLREAFDLVVTDVRMSAMTGVQLCRVLRSDPLTRGLPVVLLSASDDPRSRFWGRHGGVDAQISKERARDELVPVVARLLRERPRQAPTQPRPQHVDAAARVSAVLDQHLFEAVVASECRRLMGHIDDRAALVEAAAHLLHDVLGCPAAALSLAGGAPSHAIVLRGAGLPDTPEGAVEALGLPRAAVVGYAPESRGAEHFAGEPELFPIVVAEETLGVLRLYGGRRALGKDDRATGGLLAETIGPVVKSLLLVEETRRLAQTDALTGLANRRTLVARLEHEDLRAARYRSQLSVILLDVDRFKSVNDRFGHGKGDEVLERVARSIVRSIRNVDLAGRWGGEEFLVILPVCDENGAVAVAERIREAVRGGATLPDGEAVTVSCGVACRLEGEPSAIALVDAADRALYRAKAEGRDRTIRALRASAISEPA